MLPPLSSSLPPQSLRRSAVRSTFVSHLGIQNGDHSFLLVRERPRRAAACEYFALHGAFDAAATERLAAALRGLPSTALPLILDLCGVSALDEAFLTRLLKAQRDLAPHRPVSFQLAGDDPAAVLIYRLGLEERFGLEIVKRPTLKRTPVNHFPTAEKSASREFAVN